MKELRFNVDSKPTVANNTLLIDRNTKQTLLTQMTTNNSSVSTEKITTFPYPFASDWNGLWIGVTFCNCQDKVNEDYFNKI